MAPSFPRAVVPFWGAPGRILSGMVVVIVLLMFGVCSLGAWGMLTLHRNVVQVAQVNVTALSALTDAQIALVTTQRDNRQILFSTDPASRASDTTVALGDVGILQSTVAAYLALPHPPTKPLALAALNQALAVWLAYERIYLADLQLDTPQGDALAIALQNGAFRTQGLLLTELLKQSQRIEHHDVDAIQADALTMSRNTTFTLIGVSLLAIVSALIMGAVMSRHLSRIHARLTASNHQLSASIQEVQQRNEAISAQQVATREMNDALKAAINERLQAEAQLVTALGESERLSAHLQVIFASVQDALLMIDAQGHEIYRNRACDEILGLQAGLKVHGPQRAYTVHTVDGQRVPDDQLPLRRVLAGEAPPPPAVYFIRFTDGQRKVVQFEAVPIRMPDGQLRSVLGVIRDITRAYREEHHNHLLRSLAHHCASALTEREIAQTATHIVRRELDVPYCSILARRLDQPAYVQVLSIDIDQMTDDSQIAPLREKFERVAIAPDAPLLALRVIAMGEALFNQSVLPENAALPFAQMAFLPLRYADETFGVLMLSFAADATREWDNTEQELLRTVADEIAVALHRARLHAEAQTLAFRDPLTGLYNHRALQQRLHAAMDATTRQSLHLSVIMLDVDHFRTFNETYGHDIGDLALKTVAQAIERAIRADDVAARYGGEEFTVILPETGMDDALAIAERIRHEIASQPIAVPGRAEGISITASLGVATYLVHASVATSLLKAADIALYAAKHEGRNRVNRYSPQLLGADGHPNDQKATLVTLHATANLEAVRTLLMTIDLRDGYTAAHSEGVARYAAAIAARLGLPAEEVEMARLGGLVHDVGKIAIPDSILTKVDALTEAEWHIMREHPILGERCLAPVASLRRLLPMVRSHHEYLDGSGYPDGLRGADIPLLVRIVTVADIYEAYIADRSYHPSRSVAAGIAHLHAEVEAGRLDALVVDALTAIVAAQVAERDLTLTTSP